MALVKAGYMLTVGWVDSGGNTTTSEYDLRGADFAAASASASAILARLAQVSDGVVSGYRVTEVFAEDSLTLPAVTVQAEVSASLTVYVDGKGTKKANIRIPMPKPAVFTAVSGAGANIVDQNALPVQSFVGEFTASGSAFVSDREDAGALVGGVRITRRKRGG